MTVQQMLNALGGISGWGMNRRGDILRVKITPAIGGVRIECSMNGRETYHLPFDCAGRRFATCKTNDDIIAFGGHQILKMWAMDKDLWNY